MTLATGEVNSGGFVRDADGRLVIATDSATPLSVDSNAGRTLDYAVGVAAATVTVPTGAKLIEVEVIPSSSGGSVTAAVFGKGSIAPPAGYGIGRDFKSALAAGAAAAGQIVIGGAVGSYYVSWSA